jgi:hypothetical protein
MILFLVCAAAYAGDKITRENWIGHPDIVEVRNLYKNLVELKDSGKLLVKERKFDYCEPYRDTLRRLYSDEKGNPMIYHYERGSDDSAIRAELYYDSHAALRFGFVKAGAVNGTALEHRIYFSAAGERIWEIQKLLKGPGYTFPTIWPDSDLPGNPQKAFIEDNPCAEVK